MGLCASRSDKSSSPVSKFQDKAVELPVAHDTHNTLLTTIVQTSDATAGEAAAPVMPPATHRPGAATAPSVGCPPKKKVFVSVLHTPKRADESLPADFAGRVDQESPMPRGGRRRRTHASCDFTLGSAHNPFARQTPKDELFEESMLDQYVEHPEMERIAGEDSTPRSFSCNKSPARLSDGGQREQWQSSVAFGRVFVSHADGAVGQKVDRERSTDNADPGDLVFDLASPFPNAAPVGTPSSQRSNKSKSPMSPRGLVTTV